MKNIYGIGNSNIDLKETECAISHGERPVIETMGITSVRLEDIERKINTLSNWLFGPEPSDGGIEYSPSSSPNVSSLASSAFESSVIIERGLDEIYRRLTGN